ncbi:MAG: ABC transporter ATP-binding protein [Treponema sp.]|nr:ABC transporter ATP-binding protein [Treponema sp.]
MSYLSLRNIGKVYPEGARAISDFNLEIQEGEFIVLVGPSGCGKSTVLRMIAGLEEISSGDMLLQEKRINNLAPSDRGVAMVFQDYALYGNMTVYQNIGFSLMIRGENPDDIHNRVMAVSGTVNLFDYLNRFPKALSGGQRQRVAMGRSLAKQAKVLLMDEPLSNLDAQLRQQCRMDLAVLHSELNNTIVYVTHDQIEAMTLATRIVVMNEGRIQQIGSPYDIYNTPANLFTASFIGMPPINLIRGRVTGGVFYGFSDANEKVLECALPPGIAANAAAYRDGGLLLGIRAEDIRISRSPAPSDGECRFGATAETLELLGAEYIAGMNAGGSILNSRVSSDENITLHSHLNMVFNIARAHFFDAKTGLRLPGAGHAPDLPAQDLRSQNPPAGGALA